VAPVRPGSGNNPKLKDPFGRYIITTFVNGTNMGPYEAARHIAGVSGHELSMAANRHFSTPKLNEAIADIVNARAKLGLSRAWGDGTTAAADGTHMDTYLNNLLAETFRPVRQIQRYRLPPHRRRLYRPFHPLHSVWGVGSGLHHRGAAEEHLRGPAHHDPR
jgi:hypothetical protein